MLRFRIGGLGLVILSLFLVGCEAIDRSSKGHALSSSEVEETVREDRDALLDLLTEGPPSCTRGTTTSTPKQWKAILPIPSTNRGLMADDGEVGAVILLSHDLDGNLVQSSI